MEPRPGLMKTVGKPGRGSAQPDVKRFAERV